LHALDRHWMPYWHAAGTEPAFCLVPAGLACENQQSGRVHLEPNLQAVAGTVVLSLQAGQEPQKVGIRGNARAAAALRLGSEGPRPGTEAPRLGPGPPRPGSVRSMSTTRGFFASRVMPISLVGDAPLALAGPLKLVW